MIRAIDRQFNRVILKHLLKVKAKDAEPLEQDEEVWRTVSEGNNKGKHFLIETETGEIKGGLGGKMNGVKATPKSERTALTVSEKAMLGAAKQSKDPVEFWMNLSPEQQSKVGKNYKTVFEKLKPHAGNEPEWKPTNGTAADMPRKVDKVPEPPKFEFVNRPNESFVARETPDGVMINTGHPDYNDGVSDFVIAHELGHRVSSQNPELAEAIMANYGDLFGRYNQEKGHFDGVFAEYSPEEAFASTFGHFYTNPDMVKEHYPELYNYMQEFSEANPEMSDYVKAGIKASQQSNTPLSEKLQRIEFNPDWAFNYFEDESQKKELLKNPLRYVGLGKDAELAEILDEGTRQKAYKSDVEIDIDDLETLQPFVLKSGIDNENTLTSNMRPYVCEYKGHYILMDGNHRVSIAKLKGQKKIRVDLSVREDKNPASDTADSVQSPYNRFRPKKLLTRKTKASAIDGDWDESQHPRGEGGKFTSKGEGLSAQSHIPTDSYTKNPEYIKATEKRKSAYQRSEVLREKRTELEKAFKSESQPKPRNEWDEDDEYNALIGKRPMILTEKGKELQNELESINKQIFELNAERDKYDNIASEYALEARINQLDEWEVHQPKKATESKYEGFSTTTTGVPYMDRRLQEGKGYIAEMSPLEYLQRCAYEIFGGRATIESQINAGNDINTTEYAEKMRNGLEFDMPYLNYSSENQEGRHRAIAAMKLGIEKMPVFVYGYDPMLAEIRLSGFKLDAESELRDIRKKDEPGIPDDVLLWEDSLDGFMMDWEESRHPRGEGGRFAKSAGGGSTKRSSNNARRLPASSKRLTAETKRGRIKEQVNRRANLQDEKDLKHQTEHQLNKGIRNLNQTLEEHRQKVKNPSMYDSDWNKHSEAHRKGLLKHWQKEIANFEESIRNREVELERRRNTNGR